MSYNFHRRQGVTDVEGSFPSQYLIYLTLPRLSEEHFRESVNRLAWSELFKKFISPRGDRWDLKVLPILRTDFAAHSPINLSWRWEGLNPVTSSTFDQAISAANHSAESMPLHGIHATPSSNSQAVCGGKPTKA